MGVGGRKRSSRGKQEREKGQRDRVREMERDREREVQQARGLEKNSVGSIEIKTNAIRKSLRKNPK
jgi:hypothetical protein